jgi:hypothetical protein
VSDTFPKATVMIPAVKPAIKNMICCLVILAPAV